MGKRIIGLSDLDIAYDGRRSDSRNSKKQQDPGSLHRGLAVIEYLIEAGRSLTLGEIATAVGVANSSCHRLVQLLAREGYVMQDSTKRYRAAPKTLGPLSLYHPLNLLRRDANDTLRDLAHRFGQTSSIVIFVGTERLVLDLAETVQTLSPYYQTHLRSPLHASASGKVLLTGLTLEERERLLGQGPYERHTARTITDPTDLERELAEAERNGYAVTLGETYDGMSAVATPIKFVPGRYLGCFALVGDSRDFTKDKIAEMGDALRSAANLFEAARPSMKMARGFLGI